MNDKQLRQEAHQCQRADDLLEIYARMVGKARWPTREQVVKAVQVCADWAKQFSPLDKSAQDEANRYINESYAEADAAGTARRFVHLIAQAHHMATGIDGGYYLALAEMTPLVRSAVSG
jgi:hypothetical protein